MEDIYLVGEWQEPAVDPGLWGHAGTPLTFFTVKAGMLRMLQLRAARTWPHGYAPGKALAPPLWGSPLVATPDPGAVGALALRQQAVLARKQQGRAGAQRRNAAARRPADANLMQLYHADWMEPSPPRLPPAVRVQGLCFAFTMLHWPQPPAIIRQAGG